MHKHKVQEGDLVLIVRRGSYCAEVQKVLEVTPDRVATWAESGRECLWWVPESYVLIPKGATEAQVEALKRIVAK